MVESVSRVPRLARESQVDKGKALPWSRLLGEREKQEVLLGEGAQGLAKQVMVGGELPPAGSPRIWVEILKEVARKEGWDG